MLESITIQGFKSFAERTRLEFGPGISAVIGPNGSGKSNVVEALRWAAQQARARELRASKAAELIFHGSGNKAPLGLAEVQLELATPAGQLSLSRRLYRDGSAEQDLAGRPARVRDIHQALRGSGLGPGGLAVIGQGEVAGVVQAEGNTLLGYLQEAAGLSRAVSARQDTEQRLGQADRALREVQRVADELGLRVRDLARAAAAARRHRDLSLRELALTEALRRHRQLSLVAELSAARRKLEQLSALSAELALQTAAAAAGLEASKEALRALREVQASHRQAAELLQAAQDALSQVRRVAGHLQREKANLEADLAALTLPPPRQADGDPAGLQVQLDAARAELTRAEALRRRLADELTRAQRQQAQQAEVATRLLTQRDTLSAELMELDAGQAQRTADLSAARADLTAAAAARQQAAQLAQQLSAAREDLTAQQRRVGGELAALRAARPPLLREQSRLDESLNSHSRYGEGPRRALGSGHPGLIGSVADVLSVSAEYEVAVAAALGRRLEQVVVRRADDAREIIELLKRQGGRATFLPLELLRPRPRRDAALLSDAGVLGNLADLCPSDPPQVAGSLLADSLLVRDLAAATRLARQHHSRPRLVTLEGELLEPGGALTGGRLRDGGANLLADQRRAHDLSAELSGLAEQETRLQGSEQLLGAQLAALPAAPAVSEQAERQAERRLTQLETAQQAAEQRSQVLRARLAALLPAASPHAAPDPAPLQAQLTEVDAALTALRQQERAQTEALAAARELAAEWTRRRAAEAQRTALETRLSANAAALSAQLAEQQLAEAEVLRRQRELAERRPAELLAGRASPAGRQPRLRHSALAPEQSPCRTRRPEPQHRPPGRQLGGPARRRTAARSSPRVERRAAGRP